MKLALKVDVDTFRGTREGVPKLVEILKRHGARATFLFSLGPDHTGRAARRVFRKGFMHKVSRTSVREHYGTKTLLYGTLLPGPDIGRRAAQAMRQARDAGFEAGIHSWDHVGWQDKVVQADGRWTEREMRRAAERFQQVFGAAPAAHGAAGWQMNVHALRLTQRLGFAYSSDTRGTCPFVPVCRAEIVACPQIPTTLPTLDELIGLDGIAADNVHEKLLERTATPALHVYTLHAELEGGKLAPAFEKLLEGWRAQRYELVALREIADSLNVKNLPRHEMVMGEVPGRSGAVAVQGPEFLG
jgi:undecaprenyl phosphate-alpha-L-ara4FN deformylase